MAAKSKAHEPGDGEPKVGDWVQARGLPGQPSRCGQITEMLGHGSHEHYRVRWDERHESILYPADGVIILGAHPEHGSGAGH